MNISSASDLSGDAVSLVTNTTVDRPITAISALQRSRLALCIASMCLTTGVAANPVSPEVVHGAAEFSREGTHLEISGSDGTIINWQDFSIAAGESVNFLQTHASSAILNRVISNIPSDILGDLTSNGRVFVINPNGLIIGRDATIDTAGFVASTLDMSNADFIAGRMKFVGDSGEIENHGYIATAPGGEVVLVAPSIENHGIIEAEDGQILLAAGREVTLHSIQSGGLSYRVSAPNDKAINIGQLVAKNGSVKVFADQVFQSGSVSATRSTRGADGTVILEADSSIELSGSVDVTGHDVSGGTAHILGDEVVLSDATIDASGESGGEILIGGDYQGDGEVKNAANTKVDAATVIRADAGRNGDGGRVIVWSDGTTDSFAKITARGGSESGDGGFVETSGKKVLNFGQAVDVSAANGKPGTWLLDPEDITIDESGAESIETSLNGGSNVEVRTSDEGNGEGNITVNAPITKTEGDTEVTLTLDAHNQVHVNAPITTTAGPLNVDIKTGRAVEQSEELVTENELPVEQDEESGIADSDDSAQGGDQEVASDGVVSSETDSDSDEESNDQNADDSEVAEVSDEQDEQPDEDSNAEEVAESEASDDESSTTDSEQTDTDSSTEDQVADTAEASDTDSENTATEVASTGVDTDQSTDAGSTSDDAESSSESTDQSTVVAAQESVVQSTQESTHSESQAAPLIDAAEQQIVIAADIHTGGGDVTIDAGEDGDAIIIADIDTTDHDGDTAGDVTVEAENIAVLDDATIDASDEEAGEIQIGGGQQGQDPDIDNATVVLVGDDATLSADGGEHGDGGRIIVFAEQTSIVTGNLSARGGNQAGDGGFIETSALQDLRVGSTPDVSAPNGNAGTWLIDPRDITVVSGDTNANVNSTPAGGFITFQPNNAGGYGTAGSQINSNYIYDALRMGTSVIIDTNGSPDVAGEYGDIIFAGDVSSYGTPYEFTGSITLNAARDIRFTGTIDSYSDAAYAYSYVSVNLNAARHVYIADGASISVGGDITLYAGSGGATAGNIMVDGGLTAQGYDTEEAPGTSVYYTGSITMTTSDGSVNISDGASGLSTVHASQAVEINAGDGIAVNTQVRSSVSTIDLNANGGSDITLNYGASIIANQTISLYSTQDVSLTNAYMGSLSNVEVSANRNITVYGDSQIIAAANYTYLDSDLSQARIPTVTLTSNAQGDFSGFTDGGDDDGVISLSNDGGDLFIGAYDVIDGSVTTPGVITFAGAGVSIESSAYDTTLASGDPDYGGFIVPANYLGRGVNVIASNVFMGDVDDSGDPEITGDIRINGRLPNGMAMPGDLAGGGVVISGRDRVTLNTSEDITINTNSSAGVTYARYDVDINAQTSLFVAAQDITVTSGEGSASSINLVAKGDNFTALQGEGTVFVMADNLKLDSKGTGATLATAKDDINLVAEKNLILNVSENFEILGNAKNSTISGSASYNQNGITDSAKTFSSSVVSYGDASITVGESLSMETSEIVLLSERYQTSLNTVFGENGVAGNVDSITVDNFYAQNALIAFDRDSEAANASYAPGELVFTTNGDDSTINGAPFPDQTADPTDFGLKLSSVTWNQVGTVEWQSGSIEMGLADVAFPSSLGGSPYTYDAVAHESNLNNYGTFEANSETGTFDIVNSTGLDDFNNIGTFVKNDGVNNTNLNLAFENRGYVEARAGTIDFGSSSFLQSQLPDGDVPHFILDGGNVRTAPMSAGLYFEAGYIIGGTAPGHPNGIVYSDVTVQNTTISPGFSPGTMTVVGDFDASAGGNTFLFEVYGGNVAPPVYDQLSIIGNANIPNSGVYGANTIQLSGIVDTYVSTIPTSTTVYSHAFRVIEAQGGVIGAGLLGSNTVTHNVYGAGVTPPAGGTYNTYSASNTNGLTYFDTLHDAVIEVPVPGGPPPGPAAPPPADDDPVVVVQNAPAASAAPPPEAEVPETSEEPEIVVVIIDDTPLALPEDVVSILVTLREEEQRIFMQSEYVREKLRKVNMCASTQV